MAPRFVSHAERGDLSARWDAAFRRVWPTFMGHDAVVNDHWGQIYARFPELQIYLIDDDSDTLMGLGNAIPLAWDGTAGGLPGGLDDVLVLGLRQRDADVRPTALSALQAVVMPEFRGANLSRLIIGAMRDLAVERGLADLIAPVRPTQKSRYPLTPIERYVEWRRPDGLPLDPWLRVHSRMGAEILAVAHRSMVIAGTVAEWESWTGLAFPDSGEYVVEGALTTVAIDRERDAGLYVEPNVWMRHRCVPATHPGASGPVP